jgi:hypothetical protein
MTNSFAELIARRANQQIAVQPYQQKYSASLPGQIISSFRAIPSRKRGVSRSSRTLGAGCGGRGNVKRRMTLRADGEVVWS